ncbi:MAG: hypothetical protein ACFNUE_07890 [Bacteroides sp.]
MGKRLTLFVTILAAVLAWQGAWSQGLPKTYRLTIAPTTNGRVLVTDAHTSYTSGAMLPADSVVTIIANPAEGYELKLMTLNGDTISSGARHAVKQDVSIVATFQVSPVSAVGSVLLQEVEIPNPFSESLTVHCASRVYGATLLTPFGQVIATIEPRGGDERLEFATASLPSGLYILRLTDAHGRYRAFKVVKE